MVPLSEVPAEVTARVVSIFARDRKLLEYLHGLGIRPGADVHVLSRNYDDTLTLRVADSAVQLGTAAAEKIWIERHDAQGA